jgi:3-oxoacyl-[acyl-carrier-protein] synthase II
VARRVVVTGLGAVTPCGNDVPTTWDAMLNGRSGVGLVQGFDLSGQRCQVAGEVKNLDLSAHIAPKLRRRVGKYVQYALIAAREAMADAGFVSGEVWPEAERFGTYIGSGIGGLPEIAESVRAFDKRGYRGLSPFFIPRCLTNLATGQVAIDLNAKGPSLVISTACAVGNHSIGEAWHAVGRSDADVIIAGGTEASLSPLGLGGFMVMRALSSRVDEPSAASRPFDKDRDGFVMSEGAGMVVLEALEHAQARGARIYAELIGYGTSTDAFHVTAPSPGGEGAARCIRAALRSAGITPNEVDYINAHGTSTPMNDPTETAAIHTVFQEHAHQLAISSTKGVTGHLLGAAGAVEAVATALALYTGEVPPTAHLVNADPTCDLDYVKGKKRTLNPTVALSNGFGFGGANAILVMRKWGDA